MSSYTDKNKILFHNINGKRVCTIRIADVSAVVRGFWGGCTVILRSGWKIRMNANVKEVSAIVFAQEEVQPITHKHVHIG